MQAVLTNLPTQPKKIRIAHIRRPQELNGKHMSPWCLLRKIDKVSITNATQKIFRSTMPILPQIFHYR